MGYGNENIKPMRMFDSFIELTHGYVYHFLPMKRRFTEDSWKKEPWFRSLSKALVSCKTEEAMDAFIRDVATLSEMQALSERLEVAKLLAQGLSYRQVAAQTGASTTTVTRVAHFLENGEGGYRTVLKAHRHHRMKTDIKPMKQDPETHTIVAGDLTEGKTTDVKPVTPLQKYLQRPE